MIAAVILAATAQAGTVLWTTLRDAIADEICVDRYPGGEYLTLIGERATCGAAAATTPGEKAVQAAVRSAMPLLVSVPPAFTAEPKGLADAYLEVDEAKRDQIARGVYLSDEAFLRAVVPRITAELAKIDLTCSDCPAFKPRPRRDVTWAQMSKYVTAYFWPDPVKTPVDESGKPSGRPEYGFHVCTGLNAASLMESPDPVLLRAGYVVAASSSAMKQRVGNHFTQILNDDGFQALTTDDARTEYLRAHLPPMLVSDPGVEADTCTALEAYGADLGLKLAGCSDSGE